MALCCLSILFSLLFSCRAVNRRELEQEELFTLEIGRMEDDLDIVEQYGIPADRKNRILMQDGLFYVANGNAGKVMEFNSYGDILSLYYNSEENPEPVLLKPAESDRVISRKAYAYPFLRLGEIAVTSDGRLLAEERAQDYLIEFDQELGVSLNTIILRFSKEGEVLDYLGQEGIGGTPFPYVEDLFLGRDDTLTVVCRAVDRMLFYRFDAEGGVLNRAEVLPGELPLPEGTEELSLPSLKKLFPAPDGRSLFACADYYRKNSEGGGVIFDHSAVSRLDLDTMEWRDRTVLPQKMLEDEGGALFAEETHESIYEPIGMSSSGAFFFLAPLRGDLFELMVMDSDGSVIKRSRISLDDDTIHYRDFYLSEEGILCALLAYEFEAKVVWWRSDRFLEQRNEDS